MEQKIFDLIKKSGKILILLPKSLTADALSAGLALRLFLVRLQKDVGIVCSGNLPETLQFLPGAFEVKTRLDIGKSLVINVDTSTKKLEELSYQTQNKSVHIYLKSKAGEFTAQDVSFGEEKFPLDLIIALGGKSMDDFGEAYTDNAELFFSTPKINIDNQADNEYFGQINLVDITATSVAEILAELFQKFEEQLVDEDIATCLLAGIIAQTNSFQHIQTTPKAFLKASELVALGGRQQEIVKSIFKTKSLSLLKLWGRALARMKTQEEKGLVFSLLNFGDFERSESTEAELPLVLKELVDNTSGYKIVCLIAEPKPSKFILLAAVHSQVDVEKFKQRLGGKVKSTDFNLGQFQVLQAVNLPGPLDSLEAQLISAVK